MKKILRIIIGILIFIISFICIDGLCARFFDTRPIVSKKEVLSRGILDIDSGFVYKSLFADVYYCDTVVTTYDSDGNSTITSKVIRYYRERGAEFECQYYIDEKVEIREPYREQAVKLTNMEYMKLDAEGLYKAKYDSFGSYNKKLNVFTINYVGDYKVDYEYQDVYMFDVDNFSNDPVKLRIDGFDLVWRTTGKIHYSPSGNIMVFYYSCGYKEQWAGWQKYTNSDCDINNKENGIYVFRVDGIKNYTLLKYYSEDRNDFISNYKDSYFGIYKIIDDENILIKYTVTSNRQIEPDMEVYYIWNIVDDTITESQG